MFNKQEQDTNHSVHYLNLRSESKSSSMQNKKENYVLYKWEKLFLRDRMDHLKMLNEIVNTVKYLESKIKVICKT